MAKAYIAMVTKLRMGCRGEAPHTPLDEPNVLSNLAKAYSYDLRQKGINAIQNAIQLDSIGKIETAQVFGTRRYTIDLWLKRQPETGDYQAQTTRPHRTHSSITDLDKFAQEHGGKTHSK
jgi:hypothetical protein